MKRKEFLQYLGLAPLGAAGLRYPTNIGPASGWGPGDRRLPGRTYQLDSISVTSYGATGNGTTNDAPAIQNAINALPNGGALYFPAGTYLCTSNVHYTLNSRYSGTLLFYGDGTGNTHLKFSGASLIDGQYTNWNTGYTWLHMHDMAMEFNNGATWNAPVTYTSFDDVGLAITGSYGSGVVVLSMGTGGGPIGVCQTWRNVTLNAAASAGSNLTFLQWHADTFAWQGGGISTFLGSGVTNPMLLDLRPVYTGVLKDISMFRGDAVPATFAVVGISEVQGGLVFDRFLFEKNFTTHFINNAPTVPHITVRQCPSLSWPLVSAQMWSSAPIPVVYYENCPGWVSQNGGLTAVANSGAIAHGLATTPTKCQATATVAGHIASITAIDATALTIGLVDTNGNPVTVSEYVAWSAEL